MIFIIEDASGTAPSYYSAKAGKNIGAGGAAWISDKDEALAFARERDARDFTDVFLPHMAPVITIKPHTHQGS